MHFLMSYLGSVGTLMENTGLSDVLAGPFGGVKKMLTGKKYPENVKALRMLAKELLRPIILENDFSSVASFHEYLDALATRSRTARVWIDCMVRPVLMMMKFIHAERDSDWPLHLQAGKEMFPIMFAAGHQNYARYGLYYLRTMEAMPEKVREPFMIGEHTMHHKSGIANGIWSDMAIETTYMRYGHGL